MIQRIQSIYLLVVLIALIMLTVGTDVFVSKVKKADGFEITTHANVYGVQKDLKMGENLSQDEVILLRKEMDKVELQDGMKGVPTYKFPFFSITILLSMLSVVVLLGYKKLERQMKLGRLLFVLNFLLFLGAGTLYYIFKGNELENLDGVVTSTYLEFGFYCIAVAVAFSFLANTGIKRDLKLIKSIDRIR